MSRALPPRLHKSHGAYYYVRAHKWVRIGTDYGQALRTWAEWEGQAATPLRTVSQLLAQYIDDNRKRLAPGTVTHYEWSMRALLPVFGRVAIQDVTRAHVYEYMRRRGTVSANRERALLSAAYTWALNTGIYAGANPAAGMHYRNPERPRQRYITDAEFQRLLDAARPRWKAFLRVAYFTGLREGDLLALRLCDAGEAGIAVQTRKTGKQVLIGWSDELRAAWRELAGDRIGTVPLLLGAKGAYTSSGFRAVWRTLKLRAGLTDIHFHDLRKKTASDADTLQHAAALLAHEDEAVTRRVYRVKPTPVKPVR